MKKTLSTAALSTILFAGALVTNVSAQARWLSSYWDGCKPTCSWFQNIPRGSELGLSKSCDANDVELFLGAIAEEPCNKDGGRAHTCWDQGPFVDPNDPNIAYGYGAMSEAACGQCFEVTFTGGYPHGAPMPMHRALATSASNKRAIIMGRNTGGDVAPNQIDFMIPGGGLGMFDCFSHQLGLPNRSPTLGNQHGGLLRDCIDETIRQFDGNWSASGVMDFVQNCHRNSCNRVFGAPQHAVLLEGCLFHANWMMSAPNPEGTVRIVPCPQALIDGYKARSSAWTIMRKGIDRTSGTGQINENISNLTVGLNTGSTLTFNITAPHTGAYDLSLSVQTGIETSISVTVNGQSAGSSGNINPNDWTKYTLVPFGSKINLTEGPNTIVLSFESHSVNFDYFILVGEPQGPRFTVTYNINGGVGTAPAASTVVPQSSVTLAPAAGFTNDGFIFGGWNINAEGTGTNYTAGSTFTPTANVTLFARWTPDTTSVRFFSARANGARSNVALRSTNKGFTAVLPSNHGFESYSLIDLRGREIRKGKVKAGTSELHFSNIRQGVTFLKLKSKTGTTVLRAATL
ncbi:MAG: InlB B-repeat-containing protein [Chitinispirillia bacterium]|nr:InlB B-repeat-containing protein [Chitinispirillia bacterium]